jgi:hypothetical protein
MSSVAVGRIMVLPRYVAARQGVNLSDLEDTNPGHLRSFDGKAEVK